MFGGWDSSWRIALAEAVPITLALVPTEYIAFAIVPESTGFPNQLSLKVGFMFASLIVIAKTGADLMTPVRAYLGHLLGVG
ncbi:MAG: hypothetical protein C5B53_07465 [Candidatus Melainabacteria bacterium]|nr:MAG: hypothetical protein C5B53_07465 [Candidatus Melainabacteria bacterium]